MSYPQLYSAINALISRKDFVRTPCYPIGMTIVLGYISALHYWQSVRTAPHGYKKISNANILLANQPKITPQVADSLSWLDQPLHVLTSDASFRRPSKALHCHIWNKTLPYGSVLDTEKGFYICAPEFCFAQIAREIPLAQLIKLGFDLCSMYTISGESIVSSEPLTTVSRLTAFLSKAQSLYGSKNAMQAVQHIVDNSASPMETALTMLLCLPYRLGGYGLHKPLLNHKIKISDHKRKVISASFYVCDLFWPEVRIAVEYDSDMFHTGAARIAHDSIRRGDLSALGITVVSVTKQQIKSRAETDKLARLLAKKLGKRIRFNEREFLHASSELRTLLFTPAER